MRQRTMGAAVLLAAHALACGAEEPGATVDLEDISEDVEITFEHHAPLDGLFPNGTGVVFFDCDDDGRLDLYVTNREGPNALFRAQADGTFAEGAAAAGVADPDGDSLGAVGADFDNDGRTDLFVGRNGPNRLYRGLGDCRFQDVSDGAGLAFGGSTQSAAWGDYDGDGLLDLAWVNHTRLAYPPLARVEPGRQNRLLHNEGDGTFRDVSELLGLETLLGPGFAVTWTDYDDDGDLDLYIVDDDLDDGVRHHLYRNDGAGASRWKFTEVGAEVGLGAAMNGMGIAVGDYDNDDDLDYLVTNIGDLALFENDGSGRFGDVAAERGLDVGLVLGDQWVTWGAVFVDLDLDGWQDLFVAGGGLEVGSPIAGQPNGLFRNVGGRFQAQLEEAAARNDLQSTRTVAHGDVTGDGRPELYVVGYDGVGRLLSVAGSTDAHWLVVELEGTRSNRDGIGAKVRVTTGDATQLREIRSGASLGAGSDIAAYFGLGRAARASRVEVEWPAGETQVLEDVEADQRLTIVEP